MQQDKKLSLDSQLYPQNMIQNQSNAQRQSLQVVNHDGTPNGQKDKKNTSKNCVNDDNIMLSKRASNQRSLFDLADHSIVFYTTFKNKHEESCQTPTIKKKNSSFCHSEQSLMFNKQTNNNSIYQYQENNQTIIEKTLENNQINILDKLQNAEDQDYTENDNNQIENENENDKVMEIENDITEQVRNSKSRKTTIQIIQEKKILKQQYDESHVQFPTVVVKEKMGHSNEQKNLYAQNINKQFKNIEDEIRKSNDSGNQHLDKSQKINFTPQSRAQKDSVLEFAFLNKQKNKFTKQNLLKMRAPRILQIVQLSQRMENVRTRIIPIMKECLFSQRMNKITQNQLKIFNDKCVHFDLLKKQENMHNKMIHSFSKRSKRYQSIASQAMTTKLQFNTYKWKYVKVKLWLQKKSKLIKVFDPVDPVSIITDRISISLIVTWMFLITSHLVFSNDIHESPTIESFRVISCILFVLEILLRFNIGVYSKGNVITDRTVICKFYLQRAFIFDIIGLFILFYTIYDDQLEWYNYVIEVLFFVKYFTFKQVYLNISYRDQLYSEQSYVKELLNMLMEIAVLCHWLATIWHLIASIEMYYGETNTWLQHEKLVNADWHIRYIYSYYSALSTALLIGSIPPNAVEQACTIIFLLVTVGLFAYILSKISLIIQEAKTKSCEYKNDMELINTYMRKNHIEKSIQAKIRRHLEYVYQDRKQMKHNVSVKQVLQKLPKQLNNEIISEINLRLINKIEYFKSNFSEKTIHKLSKIAIEQNFVTNDIIVDKFSEENDPSLYIINHGIVELCFKNECDTKIHPIKKLSQGDIFGDLNFTTGQPFDITVRSCSFATVLKIRRKDYLKILRKNPEDYEKFLYIKDQLLQAGRTVYYQRKCNICDSIYHNEHNCRVLLVRPNKQLVQYAHIRDKWSKQIERQRYLRPKKKITAYSLIETLSYISKFILTNYKFVDFLEQQEQLYNQICYERGVTDLSSANEYEQQDTNNQMGFFTKNSGIMSSLSCDSSEKKDVCQINVSQQNINIYDEFKETEITSMQSYRSQKSQKTSLNTQKSPKNQQYYDKLQQNYNEALNNNNILISLNMEDPGAKNPISRTNTAQPNELSQSQRYINLPKLKKRYSEFNQKQFQQMQNQLQNHQSMTTSIYSQAPASPSPKVKHRKKTKIKKSTLNPNRRKSHHLLTQLSNHQYYEDQMNSYRRQSSSYRQYGTTYQTIRPNMKTQLLQTDMNIFKLSQNPRSQVSNIDMKEKAVKFKTYYPQYNVNNVLKKYSLFQEKQMFKKIITSQLTPQGSPSNQQQQLIQSSMLNQIIDKIDSSTKQ